MRGFLMCGLLACSAPAPERPSWRAPTSRAAGTRRAAWWHLIAFIAACGASPPPAPVETAPQARAVAIEWKAEQADGGRVEVSLVVDGKPQSVGLLDATTEMEAGTPATCALRAAHPLRTELQCGVANYYAAELHAGELVISFNDGERTVEVRRIPLEADALAVKPYAL